MDKDDFQAYSKDDKFEQLFNPFDSAKYQYCDENDFYICKQKLLTLIEATDFIKRFLDDRLW